jgi:hypothetical protein
VGAWRSLPAGRCLMRLLADHSMPDSFEPKTEVAIGRINEPLRTKDATLLVASLEDLLPQN